MSEEEGQGQEGTAERSVEIDTQETGLSDGFLKSVENPLHVPIVAQYVKAWDGEVTKRFQKIREDTKWSNDYKEFKDSGLTPDSIRQMYQFMQQEPVELYKRLAEEESIKQYLQQQTAQPPPPPFAPDPFEEMDWAGKTEVDALRAQLQRTEQIANIVAQHTLAQEEAKQHAVEDEQWNSRLNELQGKYNLNPNGVDYVNMLAAQGVNEEVAAQKWVSMVQEELNRAFAASQAPPVLSGQTPPVSNPVSLGNIPSKDVKNLIQQFLQSQNR